MSSERTVAFVASGQIPPSAPPASEVGPIHWLKANLFDGVVNSILTVVSIVAIVMIVPPLFDWIFLKGVWNADSLGGCREVIAAAHGENVEGACWAVINERFNQFIFGFYPPELYWRPLLAFALMGFAAVPVLFDHVPYRKYGLMYSATFPIIAYFLIWGGLGLESVDSDQIGGFLLALIIGVTGIAASLPIGIVLALGRASALPAIRALSIAFIELWRGVPLITVLFMASVMLPLFMPEGVNFNKLMRAMIGIVMFQSAYMAEVVRGGLQAIPKGQYEAAAALGLGFWRSMGLIILPQALKLVIPGIVNTFIALLKDTTLVLIIGLLDILASVQASIIDPAWSDVATEGYVFSAFVFWVFCFGMSRYSAALERKLETGHKR